METGQRKRKKGASLPSNTVKGSEISSGDDSGDGYFMLETDFDSESEDTSSDNEQNINDTYQNQSLPTFQPEKSKKSSEEDKITPLDNQKNQLQNEPILTNFFDPVSLLLKGADEEEKDEAKEDNDEDKMDIEIQDDQEQNTIQNKIYCNEQKPDDDQHISNYSGDLLQQPLTYISKEPSEEKQITKESNTTFSYGEFSELGEYEHSKSDQKKIKGLLEQSSKNNSQRNKEKRKDFESVSKHSGAQETDNTESSANDEGVLEPPQKKSKREKRVSKNTSITGSQETKTHESTTSQSKEEKARKQKQSKEWHSQDESLESSKQSERSVKILPPFDETILTKPTNGIRFIDSIFKERNTRSRGSKKEYLTKFRGQSYADIRWVSSKILENDPAFYGILHTFHKQEKLDSLPKGNRGLFNSDFLHVDTILERKKFNTIHYYLIKWRSLKYSECTWERHKAICDDESIALFKKRSKDCQEAIKQAAADDEREQRKGPRGRFVKYKSSPQFKDGKTIEDFQIEGVNKLLACWASRKNTIIGDDITIGARQEIVFLLYLIRSKTGTRGPFLIVTSQPLISVWKRTFECWTNFYVVALPNQKQERDFVVEHEFYFNNLTEKEAIKQRVFKFNVVIASFEMFNSMSLLREKIHWRYAIIDIASKNKQSIAADVTNFKSIITDHKTLIVKDIFSYALEEIWQMLNFLKPRHFELLTSFKKIYRTLTDKEDISRFREKFSDIILSRSREEIKNMVHQDSETIIEVEMTPFQLKCYRKALITEVDSLFQGMIASSTRSLSKILMNIRKCVDHPYLFSKIRKTDLLEDKRGTKLTKDQKITHFLQASSKLIVLDKLLSRLKEERKNVVVFVQMIELLDLLEEFFKYRDYSYVRVDGFVYGNNRREAMDTFNNDNSDCFACLISFKSTDPLVTFTNASTTIIFDSDWDSQGGVNILRSINCNKTTVYRIVIKASCEEFIIRKSLSEAANYFLVSEEEVKQTRTKNYPMKDLFDIMKKGALIGVQEHPQTSLDLFNSDIDEIIETSSTVVPYWTCKTSPFFTEGKFKSATNSDGFHKPTFWDDIIKGIIRIDPEAIERNLTSTDSAATGTSKSSSLSYSASLSASYSGYPTSQSRQEQTSSERDGTTKLQEDKTTAKRNTGKNSIRKRKDSNAEKEKSQLSENLFVSNEQTNQNVTNSETKSIPSDIDANREPSERNSLKSDYYSNAQEDEKEMAFQYSSQKSQPNIPCEETLNAKQNFTETQKTKMRVNREYSLQEGKMHSELSSPKRIYSTSEDMTRERQINEIGLNHNLSLEIPSELGQDHFLENLGPAHSDNKMNFLRNSNAANVVNNNNAGKKIWSKNEVNRLKEALDLFGYGRWVKIQETGKLKRFTLGEIAAFSRALLAKCFVHLPYDQAVHFSRIITGVDLVSAGYREGDVLLSKDFDSSPHLTSIFQDEEYWYENTNGYVSTLNIEPSYKEFREDTSSIDKQIQISQSNSITDSQKSERNIRGETGRLKTQSEVNRFEKYTEFKCISDIDTVIESINQCSKDKIVTEQNALPSAQDEPFQINMDHDSITGQNWKTLFVRPQYTYDDEPIFNTSEFIIFLREKSEAFIHRLCILAVIYDILLHHDNLFDKIHYNEKQNFDWTPRNDKALLLGTIKWGLGNYEQIKRDPTLCFSHSSTKSPNFIRSTSKSFPSDQFLTSKIKNLIKMFYERRSQKKQGMNSNSWSRTEKFIIYKMLSVFGIPQESEWEMFAKRTKLEKSTFAIKKYCADLYEMCKRAERLHHHERISLKSKQSSLNPTSQKDEGQSQTIREIPLKSESESDDSLDVSYRKQSSHGISPNNTIDSDNEKTANAKELNALMYSDEDINLIITNRLKQYQRGDHTDSTETAEDNMELSETQRHFLYKRIKFMSRVNSIFLSSPQLIEQIITEEAKPSNKMPKWWKLGEHDIYLLFGVTKYGIGQWSKMLKDPKLPFAYYTKTQEAENDGSEPTNTETTGELSIHEKILGNDKNARTSAKESFMSQLDTESSFFVNRIKYLVELLEETISSKDQRLSDERRHKLSYANWMETQHLISYKKELRFINNQLKLPINTGTISIRSIGEIIFSPDTFHTANHLFPNNYVALRKYRSIFDPNQESVYECMIQANETSERSDILRPSFYISATANTNSLTEWLGKRKHATGNDDVQFKITGVTPTEKLITYSGNTPNEVFCKLKQDIQITQTKQEERMSGSTFFGLNEDITRLAVQLLPNAELCSKYIFYYPVRIGDKIVLKQPPKEEFSIIETLKPSFSPFHTRGNTNNARFLQTRQEQDQTNRVPTPLQHRHRTRTGCNDPYSQYDLLFQRGVDPVLMAQSLRCPSSGYRQAQALPFQLGVLNQSNMLATMQQQRTPFQQFPFLSREVTQLQLAPMTPQLQQLNYSKTTPVYLNQSQQMPLSTGNLGAAREYITIPPVQDKVVQQGVQPQRAAPMFSTICFNNDNTATYTETATQPLTKLPKQIPHQTADKTNQQEHYLRGAPLYKAASTQFMNSPADVSQGTTTQEQLPGIASFSQQDTSNLSAHSQSQKVDDNQSFAQNQGQFQTVGAPNSSDAEPPASVNQDIRELNNLTNGGAQMFNPPLSASLQTPGSQGTFI